MGLQASVTEVLGLAARSEVEGAHIRGNPDRTRRSPEVLPGVGGGSRARRFGVARMRIELIVG
jgi:hypothetical protein